MSGDDIVKRFQNWAANHSSDNYGRCDAFRAGYDWAKTEFTLRGIPAGIPVVPDPLTSSDDVPLEDTRTSTEDV